MSTIKLYYDPARPSDLSPLTKPALALPTKNKSDVTACLEQQDAYTLHTPVRKQLLPNPYTFTKVISLWEFDLLDVQSLAKYICMYRYILSLVDVFRKICMWYPQRQRADLPSPRCLG